MGSGVLTFSVDRADEARELIGGADIQLRRRHARGQPATGQCRPTLVCGNAARQEEGHDR